MNIEQYREYCLSKEWVEESTPFGPDVLVFKVKGKMFALCDLVQFEMINLKCDPEKALELREQYSEVQPGYHMNKKHWNSIDPHGSLNDKQILEWTDDSYELILSSIPKSKR